MHRPASTIDSSIDQYDASKDKRRRWRCGMRPIYVSSFASIILIILFASTIQSVVSSIQALFQNPEIDFRFGDVCAYIRRVDHPVLPPNVGSRLLLVVHVDTMEQFGNAFDQIILLVDRLGKAELHVSLSINEALDLVSPWVDMFHSLLKSKRIPFVHFFEGEKLPLQQLWDRSYDATHVIAIRSSFFCTEDILRLYWQISSPGSETKLACGIQFAPTRHRHLELDLNDVTLRSLGITRDVPDAEETPVLKSVLSGHTTQVECCWSNFVAVTSDVLLSKPEQSGDCLGFDCQMMCTSMEKGAKLVPSVPAVPDQGAGVWKLCDDSFLTTDCKPLQLQLHSCCAFTIKFELSFTMKTYLILIVLLAGLVCALKANAKDDASVDQNALEKLVRERFAKKNADAALAKAIDSEIDNVVEMMGKKDASGAASVKKNVNTGGDGNTSTGKSFEANKPPQSESGSGPEGKKQKFSKTDGTISKVLDVPENVNLTVSTLKTKSEINQIEWGNDGVVLLRTNRGRVYRSTDYGANWIDLSSQLKSLKKSGSISVDRIEVNPVDNAQVVLIGKTSFGFISNNGGEAFVVYDGMTVSVFRFHPYEKSWLLALVMTPSCASTSKQKPGWCYQQLMYSHDLGVTWSNVADYVSSADWQRVNLQDTSAKDVIFACIQRVKKGDQSLTSTAGIDLFASKDYFASPASLILANANSFAQPNSYLIYASVAAPDKKSRQLINLYVGTPVSSEFPQFTRANLLTLGQRSFTIVDAAEQSVFIHINHENVDDPSGSVYMSDSSGMQFSLSLPNNRRSAEGVADFQRINGLEGVYIANYLHHQDSTGAVVDHWQGTGRRLDRSTGSVRTAITFDKGAVWSYLMPPKYDAMGEEISCSNEDDCYLHLHGVSDQGGAIYSAASAVGLIMATGSIGDQLGGVATATYLSLDAGLAWEQVAKGSHIYQFGNHGALIVMASDTAPTDHIQYSWDQAVSWYRFKISKSTIQISKIIIHPSGGSQAFLIHGSDASGNGVVVHVDFSTLHERVCEEADFEQWTPIDDRGDLSCLMGHRISYTRRKRDAQCYNPLTYEVGQFQGDCPCTDRDFECDIGFARNVEVCQRVDDLVESIENQCDKNGVHRVTKGYRRIPGNTCFNGEDWDVQIIPCSSFSKDSGHAILFALIIVAVALAAVLILSKNNCVLVLIDKFRNKFVQKFGALGYFVSKKIITDEEFEEFGCGAAHHINDDFDQDLNDTDELQYVHHPIPRMPALIQRQNGPIPRIQGPKMEHKHVEA